MKKAEMLDRIMKGERLMVSEYRREEIKEQPPKAPGQPVRHQRLVHVITGDDTAECSQWSRNGDKLVPLGFKARDLIVVEFDSFERSKYGIRVFAKSFSVLDEK